MRKLFNSLGAAGSGRRHQSPNAAVSLLTHIGAGQVKT